MKFRIIFIVFLLTASFSRAAVVSGIIRNEEGEFLPFATIYVQELDFGTTTNLEGYYEIELDAGEYTFMIQYMGYSTLIRTVDVALEDLVLNFRLQTRSLVMPNLTYIAGEDPAYAIMRKVIARSRYHLYQLKSYSTEVYVKGTGRLKKAPFFLRKRLAKEGIDSSRVFMIESLSEIKFELPNNYTQRIISVNSTEDDNSPDPMPFIKASFYQPRVAEALSPISPAAFSHYNFRYEGFFKDQGVVVNKIYVVPRIRGDNVFEGYLYIVDGLWAIHSIDFNTYYQGFNINIQQIYHPVLPEVWMPVTHRFDVEGSFMGFGIEFKYVAVNTYHDLILNDQLSGGIVVDSIKAAEVSPGQGQEVPEMQGSVPDRPLSRKEMRKIIRESEKTALSETEQDPDVMYSETTLIDSSAYSRDSSFWKNIRPIPLSNLENKSLERKDSLILVQESDKIKDSLKNEKNNHFRPWHILTGNEYSLSERSSLTLRPLWSKLSFNTVEGWNLNTGIDYRFKIDSTRSISAGPTVRYGFSSRQWYGNAYLSYHFRQHLQEGEIKLTGGRYIFQINRNNPIPFWLNMLSTLFFRENFMKLYQRDYFDLNIRKPVTPKFIYELMGGWSRNYSLQNNTDFSFSNQNKEFSPNNPTNVATGDTEFDTYQLYTAGLNLHFFPWLKFYEKNGKKFILENSSPEFSLGYIFGTMPENNAAGTYHRIQGAVRYNKTFGVDNRFEMYVAGSGIISSDNSALPFPEFHHFSGNRTPLLTENLITSFRMLDYYYYSTNKYHLESHFLYQFRRLLLTQVLYARLAGLHEDLMLSYLQTSTLDHYIEAGYALDNLFNFFRVELIGQFRDFEYQGLGIRIGFSKNISME